ncbi:putative beta-lactamase [Kockovaella imperatae]|uniref:Putative beta-lactamase n=1 Tax=Kockovaella imperatae TaxID=4999 RepID=A0A1Y1UCZ2_9TREE|nr:putative beta-lactamase [Kockovaella imperatae]ORX35394.1 putative beta-lactamase [Kockovaella imperatae]
MCLSSLACLPHLGHKIHSRAIRVHSRNSKGALEPSKSKRLKGSRGCPKGGHMEVYGMKQAAFLPLLATPNMAWWDVNAPLKYGTPESVGLVSAPLDELVVNQTSYETAENYGYYTHDQVHPLYPAVTCLVGHRNTIVSHFASGKAVLYADVNGTYLPEDQQVDAKNDTIYDLASLTKLFTTIVALDQIGQGHFSLEDKVSTYIPEYRTDNKSEITVLQLLTHTAGFPPDPVPPLFPNFTTYEARRQHVLDMYTVNPPGEAFVYSDISLMTIGFLCEITSGQSLNELMKTRVIEPLRMKDTFFNEGNKPESECPVYSRVVAEEFQIAALGSTYEPPRPQPVRGTVHDENAWALNGVSGHAGIFSTAYDLAIFCQMILNNGTYHGVKILEPWTVDYIFTNYNTKFPNNAHGAGFELNQTYWSGPMASLETAGHTGFTGTTLFIDRPSGTFAIQLTNRVHPSRFWSNTNLAREAVGYYVAQALGRNVKKP